MKNREILEKLRKMSKEELQKELQKAYLDARKERLEIESRKNQNTASAAKSRRYVAQILTLLNEEEA